MYNFLGENELLSDKQFRFRTNNSMSHAPIGKTKTLKIIWIIRNRLVVFFIDLEKAFDTINHSILCNKLNYYGFRGKTNNIIKSFVSNREQKVSINGYNSTIKELPHGVPQGSALGPLLFLIYINNLRYSLEHSTANHFPDDTCITYASHKSKILESNLN